MKRFLLLLLPMLGACTSPAPREVALAACAPRVTTIDTIALVACMVDDHGWRPESAASVAREVHDSMLNALHAATLDSVRAAAAAAALASIPDVDGGVQRSSDEDYALAMIWVGSKRTKLYYRGHCAAARAVTGADREQFSNDKMAEREGYRRSTKAVDSLCYVAADLK